jgi:hypothetical protein
MVAWHVAAVSFLSESSSTWLRLIGRTWNTYLNLAMKISDKWIFTFVVQVRQVLCEITKVSRRD